MDNTTILISGFSNAYAHLNGSRSIRITKFDIARGILTIGKTHWTQLVKSPLRTVNDFIHHWTGLQGFLSIDPHLAINSDFSELDPTEKGQKSYNIGMGISKILAERLLGIPYLQHVDRLVKQRIVIITSGTKERGDMVGLDRSNNWHVMEAKGRTDVPSKADKRKAKRQAQRIATINGISPTTKTYCITFIDTSHSEILLVDPDDVPLFKTDLNIKDDDFIRAYYDKIFKENYNQPVSSTIRFDQLNLNFSLFKMQEDDTIIYFGLENRILEDLKIGKINFVQFLSEQRGIFDRFPELNIEGLSIGPDGIILYNDIQNKIGNTDTFNILLTWNL